MMLLTTHWTKYHYLLALIMVLVITILVDRLLLNNERVTHREISQVSQSQALTSNPPEPRIQVNFTDIRLPEPPSTAVSAKRLAVPHKASLNHETPTKQADVLSNHTRPETKIAPSFDNESLSKQTIEQRYQQFVSLDGKERHLYFFNNTESALAETIEYMHTCVGIGLAAFDGAQLTNLNATPNKLYSGYSKILREVSGFKSNYERALLNTYAPGQHLIRLYPKWFDMKLSTFIANHIKNQPLTQFSGAYLLKSDTLQLTNIRINNEAVQGRWTLLTKC